MDFDEPENPDFIFSSTEFESIQSNSELLISELKQILESRN